MKYAHTQTHRRLLKLQITSPRRRVFGNQYFSSIEFIVAYARAGNNVPR